MTKALADSRASVIERMVEEAGGEGRERRRRHALRHLGARRRAVTEICAYGTAVRAHKLS